MTTNREQASGSIYTRSGKLLYQKYREFFLPTILASMTSSMAIIVDSIIVGNMLGPKEMASVNLCIPIMQFIFTFAILIGMGASTLIATAIGQRKSKDASKIFTTSLTMAVILGVLFTAISVPFSKNIASALTTDTELFPFVHDYLYVILCGCPFVIIIPILSYVIRTDGMAKLASAILVVANVINLILDIVFIGLCKMGIAGSALATICGFVISLFVVIFYWRSKRRTLKLNLSLVTNIKELWLHVSQIVKVGCPGALSSTLIVVKIFCINLLVGSIAGSDGLVIFSVCFSALSFLSMFISGTAGTMMPILGILFGQKDFRGVRLIFGYTLKLALSLTVAITLLFEIFPAQIFSLFGVNTPELLAMGIPSLRLYALSLLGVTTTFTMVYYYMTVHRHKIANMLSAVEGLVVVIPMAWALSQIWGINGIWIGFILAEVVSIGILYLKTRREIRASDGKYDDMLLIEHSEPGVLYDVSLTGSKEDAAKVSSDARKILKNNGFSDNHALQIGIVLEEMVDHAHINNKKVNVDVMITETPDNAVISIRDNGAWFNPLEYVEAETQNLIDGITLLKKIASEIKYNRVLNLNQTLIVISKN